MKAREIYIFNHLVEWYGIPDTAKERARISRILAKYEQSIPADPTTGRNTGRRQTLDEIASIVCVRHKITMAQLMANSPLSDYPDGKRRKPELVAARQEFALTARMNHYAVYTIGKFLGYNHHSAVIHLLHHRKAERTQRPVGTNTIQRVVGVYSNSSPYKIATTLQNK